MRIQCIWRLFSTWSLPTIGMLFSAWQAMTQALHPMQELRSTAIPHDVPRAELIAAQVNGAALAQIVPDFGRQKIQLAGYRDAPQQEIPASPPFLVIEIVSPDDRHQELLSKLKQYQAWGIKHIWVVEPELREFHEYVGSGLVQVDSFELPDSGFSVSAAELFAEATAR